MNNISLSAEDKQFLEQFQDMMCFNLKKGYFLDDKKSYVPKSLNALISGTMQNDLKENIFYSPNLGKIFITDNYSTEKRRKVDMIDLKSFYIDIDLKDENNESFSDSEIINKKNELMSKLHELWINKILKPSMIVESRNGYHLYYVSTIKVQLERWLKLEDVIFFTYKQFIHDVDSKVRQPGQLLRFPYSIHQKNNTQKPFLVRIIFIDKKYTLAELESSFFTGFDFSLLDKKVSSKTNSNISHVSSIASENVSKIKHIDEIKNPLVEAIKNLDVNFFKKNLERNNVHPIPISFESRDSAIIYHLCFQDISKLFNIQNPNKFSSPFRKDTNPSCSIFKKDDYTFTLYDHAQKDAIQGSVINIIEKVANVSKNQVIEFLAEIYNVSLPAFNTDNYKISIDELDNIIAYNESIFKDYINNFFFPTVLIPLYNECLELWKEGCLIKQNVPFLKHRTMITSGFLFNRLQDKYSNNLFKSEASLKKYMLFLEALHVIVLKKGGRKVAKEYTFNKINENDLENRCKLLKQKCKGVKYISRNIINDINNEILRDIFHIDDFT